MMEVPSGSAGSPGWVIPDDEMGDEDVDVLSLAGQPVPAKGAWLWGTAAEARRGGELTALVLPRSRPTASGGDVLVQIGPHAGAGSPGPVSQAQVWAVMAGSLVRVAAWSLASPGSWPEVIRDAVVFADGALRELRDHGADVGTARRSTCSRQPGRSRPLFHRCPCR
jgi:hypothetical protein